MQKIRTIKVRIKSKQTRLTYVGLKMLVLACLLPGDCTLIKVVFGTVKAFGSSAFTDERLTLPEMLQQKGYTTAAIAKWHLGWDWDAIRKEGRPSNGVTPQDFDWSKSIPDGPLEHGFDYYFGDTVINFPPYVWIEFCNLN